MPRQAAYFWRKTRRGCENLPRRWPTLEERSSAVSTRLATTYLKSAAEDAPDEDASLTTTAPEGNKAYAPATCPLCFGTGLHVVPGKGARRCNCRAEESRRRLLEEARIPRRYDSCTLRSYHPTQGNASQ